MHLNVQPRYVLLLLGTSIAFLLLFFAGVAPDVMKAEGTQWQKPSYQYNEVVQSGDHGDEHANH